MRWQIVLLFPVLMIRTPDSIGQLSPAIIDSCLTYPIKHGYSAEDISGVKKFYERSSWKFAWIGPGNVSRLETLLRMLRQSGDESLVRLAHLNIAQNELMHEVTLTYAGIRLYSELAYGKKPSFSYEGLKYAASCYDIPVLLAFYVDSLEILKYKFDNRLPELLRIAQKVDWFQTLLGDPAYAEEIISSPKLSSANKPLMKKLYYLGITDSLEKKINDKDLSERVKVAQRMFNLFADGTLKSLTLNALNVPIGVRIQQLRLAADYYRWLYCLTLGDPVVVVNIPATYLKVYQAGKIILQMKIVAGQPSTPTPTLTSKINEVILYPYWMVPHSIATKELLPRIRRNPGYINSGNFQVLNRSGKIINPYSVNWNSVSASNFPYIIRQSTGCDNSLGLMKLNFYNPFSVYLHDTPLKNFFMLNRRFLSHGCMRLEKPMELAHLVLKNNPMAIDTLEEKGCLRNQKPIVVHADQHLPVVVWYNPAGTDASGGLVFFEDIYRKFKWQAPVNKAYEASR